MACGAALGCWRCAPALGLVGQQHRRLTHGDESECARDVEPASINRTESRLTIVATRSAAMLPTTPPKVPAAAMRPYVARAAAGSKRSAMSDQKPDSNSALTPARCR